MRLGSLAAELGSGATSPEQHVGEVLARLDDLTGGPWGNLVVHRDDAASLRAAAVAGTELRGGRRRGPLHGVAVVLKDNVDVAGWPTRAGGRATSDEPAAVDAWITARLRRAGAVVVAKAHLHELAYGSTGEVNPAGPARNPHDASRMTGGSSSGSAALVALGAVALAIGTDTGCSVRAPAALCGVTGLMPALGRLPTRGVLALSSTLDHLGQLTIDAGGAALAWSVLGPPAAASPRRLPRGASLAGLRVGLPRGAPFGALEAVIDAAVERCAGRLRSAGAQVVDVEVPALADLASAYPIVVGSEAYAHHQLALQRHPDRFGVRTLERLNSHRARSASEYLTALGAIAAARQEALRSLRTVHRLDALLLATTPIRAPAVGQTVSDNGEDVAAALLRLCTPFSALGTPALSIPAPHVPGLPVGLQLVGIRLAEADLLALASRLERDRADDDIGEP